MMVHIPGQSFEDASEWHYDRIDRMLIEMLKRLHQHRPFKFGLLGALNQRVIGSLTLLPMSSSSYNFSPGRKPT